MGAHRKKFDIFASKMGRGRTEEFNLCTVEAREIDEAEAIGRRLCGTALYELTRVSCNGYARKKNKKSESIK